MLNWKRVLVTAAAGFEELDDILAGMSGKNRVIKFLGTDNRNDDIRLRVYRDANQIVDYDVDFFNNAVSLLSMDLALAEGQLCKAGIYNGSTVERTVIIAIGYEETG